MRRAPEDVYEALTAAGFDPAGATLMTAIAGAESGWNSTAVGDVGLQDATWGPSYGLFQIRTLKSDTGTGGTRDINRLAGSDVEQARAAYVISRAGTDFTAWTVYNTGAYQAHLAAAKAAAARDDDDGPFPVIGPEWAVWNWPSVIGNEVVGAGQDTAGKVLGGARFIALEATAVLLGLGLVGLGLWQLARRHPQTRTFRGAQRRVRGVVGL